jgi:riboflavin kinase/FMN adenylyltransferase
MQTFTGIVQRGKQRGRALGYPTANIALVDKELSGVFAARVTLEGEAPYRAAAFADPSRGILEAHLLDFNDDIYDLPITIELHTKLRESSAFESDEVLKRQIAQDVEAVREYFDV